MGADNIDRIRSANFPLARKGYEPRAVDGFLDELADWLETGGSDDARADVIRRELARIGEKTAAILSAAEDTAEQLRRDAEREADEMLGDAKAESTKMREGADAYSAKLREEADDYSANQRHEADGYAQKMRSEADRYAETTRSTADADAERTQSSAEQRAKETIASAEAKAERIVSEGERRRRDIEAVISDLVAHRDQVIADARELAGELTGAAETHTPKGEDPFTLPSELDPTEAAKASSGGAEGDAAKTQAAKVS